jgi:hypothetical protein
LSKTYTDLQNNFPDSVDTLDKMQDLNTSTKTMADRYYSMVEANNITGANEYLVQNPSLALSVFNADKYNKLRDAIVSVERFFYDEVKLYIGDKHEQYESIDGGAY